MYDVDSTCIYQDVLFFLHWQLNDLFKGIWGTVSYSFKCAIKAFTIRDLKNATTVSQLVKVTIL